MYKLVAQNTNDPEAFGKLHPNSPLPNMKEITLADWAKSKFFMYTPHLMGYRQIHRLDELKAINIQPPKDNRGREYMMAIKWFLMHDNTGFAIHNDYSTGTIRVFKFATCEHTFTSKTTGKCLTLYTCTKCSYSEEIDSSD